MADPWDKLPDEPTDAYARFLTYRNCGPRRSVRRTYATYLKKFDVRPGDKGIQAPKGWWDESRKFRWAERAGAWDLRNLAAYGARVAVLHVKAIARVAKTNYDAAGKYRPGDPEWGDLMASLRAVAGLITPELLAGATSRPQPAHGAPAAPAAPVGRESVK